MNNEFASKKQLLLEVKALSEEVKNLKKEKKNRNMSENGHGNTAYQQKVSEETLLNHIKSLEKKDNSKKNRNRLEETIDQKAVELRLAKDRLEDEINHRIEVEKELRALNADMIDEYEERKALSKRLIHMLEKDRLEMASFLHDQFGQILATLKMDMEKVMWRTKASLPLDIGLVSGICEKIETASKTIKNISKDLSPTTLDRLGLVPSLRVLLNKIIETSTLEIIFHHDDIPRQLEPDIALAVYRTVQEALSNIIKYSQAQKVYVCLTLQSNSVCISVEDDGIGFDVTRWHKNIPGEGAFGLTLMRERIMQFEGEFTMESEPGRGTLVMAHIPLDCA